MDYIFMRGPLIRNQEFFTLTPTLPDFNQWSDPEIFTMPFFNDALVFGSLLWMVLVVETITMQVEYNETASACDTFNVRIQLIVVVLGVEPYVHEGRSNLQYGYRLIQYLIKGVYGRIIPWRKLVG